MEVQGKVVKRVFGAGTKSEHDAVTLVTDNGDFKLRRKDGNPFFDPDLEDLVGKTIRCEGFAHDYTFVISDFEEILDAGIDTVRKRSRSELPPGDSLCKKEAGDSTEIGNRKLADVDSSDNGENIGDHATNQDTEDNESGSG